MLTFFWYLIRLAIKIFSQQNKLDTSKTDVNKSFIYTIQHFSFLNILYRTADERPCWVPSSRFCSIKVVKYIIHIKVSITFIAFKAMTNVA